MRGGVGTAGGSVVLYTSPVTEGGNKTGSHVVSFRLRLNLTSNPTTVAGTYSGTGAYRSDFGDQHTASAFLAAGHAIGDAFAANLYVLRPMPAELPATTTPALVLQERLSERYALTQLVSWSGGRLSTSLGGTYRGETIDLGVGYGFVHAPLDPAQPFQRTLNLSVRLQLGNYRAAVATTVTPSGAVVYDASAATFLYLGGENGLFAAPIAAPLTRYVVQGIVRDDRGAPLSGAALLVGDELVYSE